MDQIEEIKRLVKEAQIEAKKHNTQTKGTCINPKRTLFGRRIAEHNWSQWTFLNKTEIYGEDSAKLPVRTEATYYRRCCLCGDIETKRVIL